MWKRFTAALAGVTVVVSVLVLGCSRSAPTQPAESLIAGRGEAIWGARGIAVYRVPGQPDELLVQYGRIVVDGAASGERRLITVQEALQFANMMPADQIVRWSSSWRVIPASAFRADSPDLSAYPAPSGRQAGRFDTEGEDPPPVIPGKPPEKCGGCCHGGDVTWGCLHCCYG
ncbi:MAG: hypothetical protein HZC42_12810 [Candidatus Eisenbacteria bacterium]|nr:hypothetical protein [Candidatus Eisenbacteria bacterium]